MQNGFVAETAQTSMSMYNFNLLADDNVAEHREEGKDRWESCLAVHDQKRNMVDLEAIRTISDSLPAFVCVRDYDHLMSSVDEFRGELVDMTLNASGLGKKEVAHHGDVVGCPGCPGCILSMAEVMATAGQLLELAKGRGRGHEIYIGRGRRYTLG